MPIDPNRSSFVQQEFRYEIAEDLSIRETYSSARELVMDTNLDGASAASLATKIFSESGVKADAYEIEVEGLYGLDDIEGGPLRFILDIPDYVTDGRVLKVAAIKPDPLRNRTTLVVRG